MAVSIALLLGAILTAFPVATCVRTRRSALACFVLLTSFIAPIAICWWSIENFAIADGQPNLGMGIGIMFLTAIGLVVIPLIWALAFALSKSIAPKADV